MKKIVIVIPLLILVVVLGSLIVHAYFTASELRVEDVTIVTLQIDSSWCTCNPYTPIIKNIDLSVTIMLYNPTDQPIEIKRLNYEIYIENTHAGSGSIEDLKIAPGRYYLNLSLSPWSTDILKNISTSIGEALRRGIEEANMSIRVSGEIVIIVKIVNLFKVAEYTKSFSYLKKYKYSFTYPLYTKVRGCVIDFDSGTPIPGVRVILKSRITTYEGISDDNGEFIIKRIVPGIYDLVIEKEGYILYKTRISVGKEEVNLDIIKLKRKV